MPFDRIYAQDTTIDMLRRTLTTDQVGHAYLFSGPEGIGKRTIALAYAKALNCTDEQARKAGDFCDACRSCRMISLGQHPDVRLLTPETSGDKTVISIDAIRTKAGASPAHPLPLREDAQLKPMEGRQKVYILDPANRPGLQEDAGNALLLTVEEPPAHVVMILISSRPSAVLPTLVSRCRPVRFHLAPSAVILQAVSSLVSPEEAAAITGMADGRIGWAIACAGNRRLLDARQRLIAEINALLPAGRPAALRLAELLHLLALIGDDDDVKFKDRMVRRNLPDLLDVTASWWRDLLVGEVDAREMRINVDFTTELDRCAGRLPVLQLQRGLQAIVDTKRIIERNANIDLALEHMWMTVLGD